MGKELTWRQSALFLGVGFLTIALWFKWESCDRKAKAEEARERMAQEQENARREAEAKKTLARQREWETLCELVPDEPCCVAGVRWASRRAPGGLATPLAISEAQGKGCAALHANDPE